MGGVGGVVPGGHVTRVRKATTVGESRREEECAEEHLAYSPSTGSLANASGAISGEEPNATNSSAHRSTSSAFGYPALLLLHF